MFNPLPTAVPPTANSYKFSSTNSFDEAEDHWSHGVDSLYTDTTGISRSTAYYLGNSHEFGPTFTIPLNEFADHKNDLIDVSFDDDPPIDIAEIAGPAEPVTLESEPRSESNAGPDETEPDPKPGSEAT